MMFGNCASFQAGNRNGCRSLRELVKAAFVVAALACFLSVPAQALGESEVKNATCENAQTTAAMRQCENARLKRAEEAMDRAYQALTAKLDAAGREKLRAAQEAWLKFRAAEANYQADLARDGTLAPLIRVSVQADMTESRKRELERAAQAFR